MTEAHAQDGNLPGVALDDVQADARLVGGARTRGDHDVRRREAGDRRRRDLVVAHDAHVLLQLTQVLNEVVGERIVVVDHEQHQLSLPVPAEADAAEARRATSTAPTTARALLAHSLNPSGGTLPATTPAPAWT